MTVSRALHKPDWSWPTRLAPLLHEIMFRLGLSYVKGGAILGHNKNVLSMKTMSSPFISKYWPLLALCHQHFNLPRPYDHAPSITYLCSLQSLTWFTAVQIWQNINSLYFLNWLMCKLLLHCLPSTSGKSQVENVDGRGFSLSICKLHL